VTTAQGAAERYYTEHPDSPAGLERARRRG